VWSNNFRSSLCLLWRNIFDTWEPTSIPKVWRFKTAETFSTLRSSNEAYLDATTASTTTSTPSIKPTESSCSSSTCSTTSCCSPPSTCPSLLSLTVWGLTACPGGSSDTRCWSVTTCSDCISWRRPEKCWTRRWSTCWRCFRSSAFFTATSTCWLSPSLAGRQSPCSVWRGGHRWEEVWWGKRWLSF